MIESILESILRHDKVVIVTDSFSIGSLDKLLKVTMNYLGDDNYIKYNNDDNKFTDFLVLHKHEGKRVISTTLGVWLTSTDVTNSVFDDTKFILPYSNMTSVSGLPHFVGSNVGIPTKLTYKADLILSIGDNKLTVQKMRSMEYFSSTIIDLEELFLEERNLKVKKLRKLIS